MYLRYCRENSITMGRLGHESGRDEGTCPHIQIGQVNTGTFAPEVHSTALNFQSLSNKPSIHHLSQEN